MLLLSLLSTALAESAGTLGKSATVVFAGLGTSTHASLRNEGSTTTRDRALWGRLDLYASRGLADHLQVSLSTSAVHARVLDLDGEIPCFEDTIYGGPGYCEPITGVSHATLDARVPVVRGSWRLTTGLALEADPWNEPTRGRYAAIGPGAWSLVPQVLGGASGHLAGIDGGFVAFGRYHFGFGEQIDFGPASPLIAPADVVGGGLEVYATFGKVRVEVGAAGAQAVEGQPWDDGWLASYWPKEERWIALSSGHLDAHGKLSYDLGGDAGLHLSATRTVAARGAPADMLDVGVGVHKYWD